MESTVLTADEDENVQYVVISKIKNLVVRLLQLQWERDILQARLDEARACGQSRVLWLDGNDSGIKQAELYLSYVCIPEIEELESQLAKYPSYAKRQYMKPRSL